MTIRVSSGDVVSWFTKYLGDFVLKVVLVVVVVVIVVVVVEDCNVVVVIVVVVEGCNVVVIIVVVVEGCNVVVVIVVVVEGWNVVVVLSSIIDDDESFWVKISNDSLIVVVANSSVLFARSMPMSKSFNVFKVDFSVLISSLGGIFVKKNLSRLSVVVICSSFRVVLNVVVDVEESSSFPDIIAKVVSSKLVSEVNEVEDFVIFSFPFRLTSVLSMKMSSSSLYSIFVMSWITNESTLLGSGPKEWLVPYNRLSKRGPLVDLLELDVNSDWVVSKLDSKVLMLSGDSFGLLVVEKPFLSCNVTPPNNWLDFVVVENLTHQFGLLVTNPVVDESDWVVKSLSLADDCCFPDDGRGVAFSSKIILTIWKKQNWILFQF